MNANRKRKDRDAFVQGILYFIDSDERENISKTDLYARVKDFLGQHAFHFYRGSSNRIDDRELVTVPKFIDSASHLASKDGALRRLPGEDLFDALYRDKSECLSAEFLEKHNYSKPFNPRVLPGPPDDETHLDGSDHVPSSKVERWGHIAYARHLAIQAVDEAKTSAERDDWKFRNYASRIAAFDSLCQRFDLKRQCRDGSIMNLTGQWVYTALSDFYGRNCQDYGLRSFEHFFTKGSENLRSSCLDEQEKIATDFAEVHGLHLPAILAEIRSSVEEDQAELTSPDGMPLSKRRLPRELAESSFNRNPSKRRATTPCHKNKKRAVSTRADTNLTKASTRAAWSPGKDFLLAQQLHREISELCKSTVQDLISQLYLDASQSSPVIDMSDPTMSGLCKVIFGNMDATKYRRLRSEGCFKATQVLHALIGSWIYTKVLQSQDKWERKACSIPKTKEMRTIFLDLSSPTPSIRQQARQKAAMINAQQNLARVADDDLVFEEIAHPLVNEFMPSLNTQIRPLIKIGSQLNRSDDVDFDQTHFATRLQALVNKSMRLKLNLDVAFKGEYSFFWPKTADVFESESHSVVQGEKELGFVAYTSFPGVRAKKACGGNEEVQFPAQVVCCKENPGVKMGNDEMILQ